ncbi:MAG TPA: HAMP domain-containing sensor histidine kinase [Prosthecobacter sp.]
MKWLPNSIRWRIQLWHALLLLAVLVVFGVTAWRLQYSNEIRLLDGQLHLLLSELHTGLAHGGDAAPRVEPDELALLLGVPDLGGPPVQQSHAAAQANALPHYHRIWWRDGTVNEDYGDVPPGLTLPPRSGAVEQRTHEGFREVYQFTPPGECLLVGVPETVIDTQMNAFLAQVIGICAVVLVLGVAGGGWMASRAIAPIRDISDAAQRIASGHLKERIPVAETESELGRLASVLNDTFTQLDAAFQQQARFTSDAAHELRTPVAIILAQTQLALSKPRPVEAHVKTIEMARRSDERMQELIESLLTLAKADAGAEAAHETVHLDALSRENLDHIRPLAEEKKITLHGDLPPTTCKAHAGHVAQILTNLLGNAVKYCRPGDEVRVSTHRQNGHAILTVMDTGPGIPVEHLPYLFDRFYRAEASRNRAMGGAGLGLAICKTLVEAHGGRISVESRLQKGTTFQVTLPA